MSPVSIYTHTIKYFAFWYSTKVWWTLWNIIWLILNITWLTGVWGSIKEKWHKPFWSQIKWSNFNKSYATTWFIERHFWYILETKVISAWALFSNSQILLNVSGEGKFDSNLFQSWLHFNSFTSRVRLSLPLPRKKEIIGDKWAK